MSCIADEVVAAWLDGELAEQERAGAILHATGCGRCRELVGTAFGGEHAVVTIGRYEIVGPLAAGGMGVVLRGRDPVLDRAVAIKLAHTGTDDARMLREAQAIARLNHPNVVAVHDFGESGGDVFLAMALVDGVPLSRWTAKSKVDALRVLDGVAAGLAAIHDAGLVHRDIKPDNVVVRPNGQASIVDFGLARDLGAIGSGIAGTRHYVAPEVLAGKPATPASDQFAWWTLAGDVLRDIALRPRERARLNAAIARGTSNERYPDMRAAAGALRRAFAPRWHVPIAFAAAVQIALVVTYFATRAGHDPCAWSPAWNRAAVATGLRTAGVNDARVLATLDKRATATRTLRHEACELGRHDDPDERALGQYRIACLDRTWAETTGFVRGLSSTDREEVWSTLDQLALVLDPSRCTHGARAILAPPPTDPNAEVTRLGRELLGIARDASIDTPTRLARIDDLEAKIVATKYAPLAARWHVLRASELQQLGRSDEAGAALERGELAAEASGDDDLRAEIAINRLVHAYSAGRQDTAALEARAVALVDKLDNPVRRAELADARGMLLSARDDLPGAIKSMREAADLYDQLSLDASERAVRALQNLAGSLQLTGDLDAAQQVFDRGLAVSRRRFGEDSASTFEMRGARATNLLYAGHAEEARRELAVVVDGLAKHGGPGDRALGMAQLMLCQAETEARAASAIDSCHAALAGAEAAFGADDPQVVAYLTLYGNALRMGDRAKDAVDVLVRAIRIGERGTIAPGELGYARAYFALALHAVEPNDPRTRAMARAALAAITGRPDATSIIRDLEPLAK